MDAYEYLKKKKKKKKNESENYEESRRILERSVRAAGIVAETNAQAERLRARDDVTSGVKRTARNSSRFPFLFFSPPSRSQRSGTRRVLFFASFDSTPLI